MTKAFSKPTLVLLIPLFVLVFDTFPILLDQKSNAQNPPTTTTNTTASASTSNSTIHTPIRILSFNSFKDSSGAFHIVGEVENDSPNTAKFVQVIGTFYDVRDQVVGTNFTYTTPTDIEPGEKAPFDLILMSVSVPIRLVDHFYLKVASQYYD